MTPAPSAAEPVPAGFRRLNLVENGFIDLCGPLYGRWADGRFTMGLRVEQRHCNPGGTCHGGMLLTLADMTMLIGSNLQAGLSRYLVTINLATDFIAPAPRGAWIEGRVDVLRASKNLLFAQGSLSVEDGIVARISGIFKPTGEPNERFALPAYFAE